MNTQIYQEASDWLVRNRDGRLDATEKKQFDAWLRQSPQHIQAYLELSAIWEGVAFVPPEFIDDADGLVARARAESSLRSLEPGARSVNQNVPKRAWPLAIAMAATVLLSILGGVFWHRSLHSTFATDIGSSVQLFLPTGRWWS
jgi:transmembrane sensor